MKWFSHQTSQASQKPHSSPRSPFRSLLQLETLEDRVQPSVNIAFDYSLDTSGFFSASTPDGLNHRAVLQAAANTIGANLQNNLQAISPSGSNIWSPEIFNPATGALLTLPEMSVPVNTIIIYVAGRSIGNSEAGLGATGGEANITGTSQWISNVSDRGQGNTTGSNAIGFGPWGGSIAFDTNTNWFFGTTASGMNPNQVSFFTVAEHELGHVLGFGTAPSFQDKVVNNTFVGSISESVYGGPVPLSSDQSHWAESVTSGGQQAVMTPVLSAGSFLTFTSLDYAGLEDIGWLVGPSASTPAVVTTSANTLNTTVGTVSGTQFYATGTDAGNASHVNVYNANGSLRFSFYAYQPQYLTGVNVAVGDVFGKGYDDIITAPASGGGPEINVYDGMTGQLVYSFYAYDPSFTGGVTLAVGDTNGSGHDNIITGTGTGGGPNVKVFDGITGSLLQSFYAYEPTFTGGVNVAAGDITGSGHADIITGTLKGSPRVVVYDGETLQMLRSFYAYSSTFQGGVFVSAIDVNGNDIADIITSPGAGLEPLIQVFDPNTQQVIKSFVAGSSTLTVGTSIATHMTGPNGDPELYISYGPGIPSVVFAIDLVNLATTSQMDAYESTYLGGVHVG